jgi:glucose-6-phosphate isomerase
LAELQDLGIDLERIGQDLQVQSLAAFSSYFQSLIGSVITKRDQLDHDWQGFEPYLGPFEREVVSALAKFCEDRTLCQIWAGDHTVWNPEPEEIANRLGWMHSVETMQENTNRLKELVRSVLASNGSSGPFTDVVVLGMGGSSLAAQLFGSIFANWTRPLANQANYPVVSVLDTTDPDDISTLSNHLDMERTLFIVSSKSGRTVETLSCFKYFYNLAADVVGLDAVGDRFIAITDPGTALVDIATRLKFRELFLNNPNIGGRYSVLSYFGLVPAALAGVDVDRFLDRAFSMACNAHSCNCPMKGDNIAAQFGVILGNMVLAGRDKLTFITSPSIAAFAGWAEQLIAESTGKEGKGILPVVGETITSPDSYGDDRLFVYVRLDGDGVFDLDVQTLIEASHPVVTFHLRDHYDLGGLFFTWEMATAVAGYLLGVNPFDQPNVEEAKVLARKMISEYRQSGFIPDDDLEKPSARALHEFLGRVRAGDYIAIQAYLRRSADTDASLHELRTTILDHYRVATTVGYGPRYLHSTGQLHKGDGGNGLFIQLTADPEVNIPIPNEAGKPQSDISFGHLIQAQANGDAKALRNRGRRLIRFHLGKDILDGLEKLGRKEIYA